MMQVLSLHCRAGMLADCSTVSAGWIRLGGVLFACFGAQVCEGRTCLLLSLVPHSRAL